MLINIHCAKCGGIEALPIVVEVDITSGLGIHLVGLADVAVKESLLRTITALQSMGFRIPGKKIVINLAPADMHKKGSGYDVPIALGIIKASGQRELPLLEQYIIMGELGLDGTVRAVPGALPIAELASASGMRGCILPYASATEALEYEGIEIYGVDTLDDVLKILEQEDGCRELMVGNRIKGTEADGTSCGQNWDDVENGIEGQTPNGGGSGETVHGPIDFSEIIGQEGAKRGIEIAAAGGHNVIKFGYLNTTPYLCKR